MDTNTTTGSTNRLTKHPNPTVWTFPEYTELRPAVKRFFEILDEKESSDSGVDFNPIRFDIKEITIHSCRVYKTAELESLLPQMKLLANTNLNT